MYINRPHQKRGVVQKGMIQTIKTSCDDVGVVVETKFKISDLKPYDVIEIDDKAFIVGSDGITLFRVRKLTPREALRLMDVNEKNIDTILNLVSNSVAYKLAGNSIVVNVLYEILKQMIEEE